MRRQLRPPPDGGLKEPIHKFEDTFSAETLIMETFFPDPEAIKVMVKAGYPDFDEMNPTQQAFAQAQCGMMLYALMQAGYKITLTAK